MVVFLFRGRKFPSLFTRIDDRSRRDESPVGNFHPHDDGADADKTMGTHHRIVHHRFKPDERMIADVTRPVHECIMRNRHISTHVHRPRFSIDENMFVFKRVNHHAVLDVGVRPDIEGSPFVRTNRGARGDVNMIAEHYASCHIRLFVNVGRTRRRTRTTNIREPHGSPFDEIASSVPFALDHRPHRRNWMLLMRG